MKWSEDWIREEIEEERDAWLSQLPDEGEVPEHVFSQAFCEQMEQVIGEQREMEQRRRRRWGVHRFGSLLAEGVLAAALCLLMTLPFLPGIFRPEETPTEAVQTGEIREDVSSVEPSAENSLGETDYGGGGGGRAKIAALNRLKFNLAAMKKDIETHSLEEFLRLYPDAADSYQQFKGFLNTMDQSKTVNVVYRWYDPANPESGEGNILLLGYRVNARENDLDVTYQDSWCRIAFVYRYDEKTGALLLVPEFAGSREISLMKDYTFAVERERESEAPEHRQKVIEQNTGFYSFAEDGTVQIEAEIWHRKEIQDLSQYPATSSKYERNEEGEERIRQIWFAHGGKSFEQELYQMDWRVIE